ncbi:hypothetical protein C8R45DRAFT_939434 [Mycena sanguinolenta]|nr:hypothetical protein C8R45DRAFT_939434 [Mycena sanguinolenta]
MFNFKALFTATLLAATATTVWGKAQAVLYASSGCTGSDHSDTIGMSTGVCHSTSFTSGAITQSANSIQFYTDGVDELYNYYTTSDCTGSASQTDNASGCIEGIAELHCRFKLSQALSLVARMIKSQQRQRQPKAQAAKCSRIQLIGSRFLLALWIKGFASALNCLGENETESQLSFVAYEIRMRKRTEPVLAKKKAVIV